MLSFSEMGIPWSGPRSRGPLRPPGAKSSDSAFLASAGATSVVMGEISEGGDGRDDKRKGELILLGHRAEVDGTVLEGQAAAAAIVTELHDLALQCLVLEVVAETGDEI